MALSEKQQQEKINAVYEMYKNGKTLEQIKETIGTSSAFVYSAIESITGERPEFLGSKWDLLRDWEITCKHIRDNVKWCKKPAPGVRKIVLKGDK